MKQERISREVFQILSYLSIVGGLSLGIILKNTIILGLGIIFCVTFQTIAFGIKKGSIRWKNINHLM